MAYKINDVFSALADTNRRQILMMLSNNTLSVNSIAGKFKISRPAISKHLKILVNTKLVTPGQRGRERYYKINVELNGSSDLARDRLAYASNVVNGI